MAPKSRNVGLNIVIAGDPKGASKAFRQVETDAQSMSSKLKGYAAGAGALFAGAAVVKWGQDAIKTYRSVGGEVLKLERLTGDSAEQAAGLWVAAQQSGVGVDKLSSSIGILSSKLNNKKVAELGIDLKTADGAARPFNDVLRDIMDKFASMENGAEKNLLAKQLFGKSGADLIPLLNRGSAALDEFEERARKLGIAVNSDDVKAATKNQRDFSLALTASQVVIGRELLPAVTAFTSFVARNLPTVVGVVADVASAFNSLPGPVKATAAAMVAFGPAVKVLSMVATPIRMTAQALMASKAGLEMFRYGLAGVTQQGAGAANAAGAFVSKIGGLGVAGPIAAGALALVVIGLAETAARSRRAEENVSNLVDLMESGLSPAEAFSQKLANTLAGVRDGFSLEISGKEFRKSLDTAGVSAQELGAALNGPKADFLSFVDALQVGNSPALTVRLRSQLLLLRKEQEQAVGKTETLAEVEADLGIAGDEATASQTKLAGATYNAADAFEAATSKADDLFGLYRGASDAADDVNQAVIGVADAQADVADAERDVADARGGVADANKQVADARAGVTEAERGVEAAKKGVAVATRGVVEAEQAEADARAEVVDLTEDLADAMREAAGDSDALRTAHEGVSDASERLEQAQRNELDAQEALTAARENYDDVLKGLGTTAEAAADDVLQAEIRLRKAQESLATLGQRTERGEDGAPDQIVQDPVSADERLEAEIAIREATRALARAQVEAAAAAAKLEEQKQAGVDGSDAVVAAQTAATQASKDEQTARENLEGAVQNVADTQQAAAERVTTAQDNLAAANDRVREAQQRIIDARASVVEAQAGVQAAVDGVSAAHDRVREALDGVSLAQQKVTDATGAVVEARGKVRDAEQEVVDKLLLQIQAQKDLNTATGNAKEATRLQIEKLRELAGTLDPSTSLRRDLDTYISDLEGTLGYLRAIETLGSIAPPGAVNAERQNRSGGPKGAGRADDKDPLVAPVGIGSGTVALSTGTIADLARAVAAALAPLLADMAPVNITLESVQDPVADAQMLSQVIVREAMKRRRAS